MSLDALLTTAARDLDATAMLPDDPAILRQMILELIATLRETRRENEHLQHRLDLLLRRLYGPRTERFDPNQALLIPDLLGAMAPSDDDGCASSPEPTEPAPEPPTKPTKKQRGHGRKALPKNLRRIECPHVLTEAERACPECGTTRGEIGTERSEQLDFIPASLVIVEHVRHTYACQQCEGHVVTAGKPAQPIPKGLPGAGLLAHVITEKYVDHIPLHRQESRLARQGVELTRSTLCDWMGGAAKLLTPLYELMKSLVLASAVIRTDDTPVKVRDSERKIKVRGSLWAYFGDHAHPFNVFDFTMNHTRDGPLRFLGDYHRYLQADAFSGYDGIYAGKGVIEVGCNAHARRKFVDAVKTDAARAAAALGFYRQLYGIERAIKNEIEAHASTADEDEKAAIRLRVRQAEAVPVWDSFEQWLSAQKNDVLPKSPMGEAFGYLQNNWEALRRYTSCGYLEIDNNTLEQAMKKIATGRKNWLFVGSENGGKTMAILFTLTSSCQRHGHDPFAYLRDVLTRLPELPQERWAELLPDRWSLPKADERPVEADGTSGAEQPS